MRAMEMMDSEGRPQGPFCGWVPALRPEADEPVSIGSEIKEIARGRKPRLVVREFTARDGAPITLSNAYSILPRGDVQAPALGSHLSAPESSPS